MDSSEQPRPLIKNFTPEFTVPTNIQNTLTVQNVKVPVIEMEDVLFHLDSAVMMPETPAGEGSSGDGIGDNPEDAPTQDDQNKKAGITALASVFKLLQFDPSYRTIITAHADTSAGYNFNFTLTRLRGENVFFLLKGPSYKEAWADNCASRHRIEDYQQVLAFASVRTARPDWHPVKIDDKWGPLTESALKTYLYHIFPDQTTADAKLSAIKSDAKKKWPADVWMPMFDIYQEAVADALGLQEPDKETQLAAMRQRLDASWIDTANPFVNCGEMWPIDSAEKNNYRSQLNRRVEILFFSDKLDFDLVALLQCTIKAGFPSAEGGDNASQKPDLYRLLCPIWPYRNRIEPIYIPPEILVFYTYHLRFVYYDRIRESNASVPGGLVINAFEIRGGQTTQLQTTATCSGGVYWVNIKPADAAETQPPDELFFTFDATDHWIRTRTINGAPVSTVEKITDAAVAQLDFDIRREYHRIPKQYSTRGMATWYDKDADYIGDFNNGETYETVVKDTLQLKPFGTNTTQANRPLTFLVDPKYDDDTPAALIYPSIGCPSIVHQESSGTVLYCYAIGAPLASNPDNEITALKVNKHLKILRWKKSDNDTAVSDIPRVKKALLQKTALPPEFDEPFFASDQEATSNIVVRRVNPDGETGFRRHEEGFYCGERMYFNFAERGMGRFSEAVDGITLDVLYEIKITLPEKHDKEGFYNLFWINKGQELEDFFFQNALSRVSSDTPSGNDEQAELLGRRVVRHLMDMSILYSLPVDISGPSYSLTNIDTDAPLCSYHPVQITAKKFPGIACLGDLHIAARLRLLKQSGAKVIEVDDPEMETIGSMISDPFLTTSNLLAQAGADPDITVVFITGDLIDYIKSFFPLSSSPNPLREDNAVESLYPSVRSIWDAAGFGSKGETQVRYQDGIDFISIYSLLVDFTRRYGKPFYVVAGNHDPYYWPWGISPRVGPGTVLVGGNPGNPWWEWQKANEGIAADANLTIYEAILAYGEPYGVILEAQGLLSHVPIVGILSGDPNLKPEKFELFHTLFTPFADFAIQFPHWTLTGLFWGNDEDLVDVIGGQTIGHLPRSDEAITDTQLELLRLATDRTDSCNILMSHFTFISYLESEPLLSNGHHGRVGDVEFDWAWDPSHFDTGTFEINRVTLYRDWMFGAQKRLQYIFTGHMHRRGLYDITAIDYEGDNSVKTRFWDVTLEDFNRSREDCDSTCVFVPDSAGNIPRYNLCGEFVRWGSEVPSLIKCILGDNGNATNVGVIKSTLPKSRPRIAVAIDYLYTIAERDFVDSFTSVAMAGNSLLDESKLEFVLQYRHRHNEFDYRCLGLVNVKLYTQINGTFHFAEGVPQQPYTSAGIRILFTFPDGSGVSPRMFKQRAGSDTRRTFISFRFPEPAPADSRFQFTRPQATLGWFSALEHYNFTSRYNYEVRLEERAQEESSNRFFVISRLRNGSEEPDWDYRRQIYT